MIRLTSGLWVSAWMARARGEGVPVYVLHRGDPVAGAVAVKLATLDGRAQAFERMVDLVTGGRQWVTLAEGAEAEVDAALARARARDPDLWVLAVEDRRGRHFLDAPGLSD